MDGSFLVLGVGIDTGAGWAAVREDAHRVIDALQPWATESAYLLMVDDEIDERRGWPAAPGSASSTSARRPTPTGCSSRPIHREAGLSRRLKSAARSSQEAGSTVVLHHHHQTRRNP